MKKDENIAFRKCNMGDLSNVNQLFLNAIDNMNRNNIPQWDEVYPNMEDIKDDITKEELYVGEIDNEICSVFALNKEADEKYSNGDWKYIGSDFIVLHRLCVNPQFQNKGIGRKTILYIESMIRGKGIKSIRLDAFSLNPYVLKMYEGLGYNTVGEVDFRKGLFYLMEKIL